jgi:hypothetical protein
VLCEKRKHNALATERAGDEPLVALKQHVVRHLVVFESLPTVCFARSERSQGTLVARMIVDFSG